MFALLEERGYKRWEIGRLSRGYIARIIGYPRDDKNQLEPEDTNSNNENYNTIQTAQVQHLGRSKFERETIETLKGRGWHIWQIMEYLQTMQQQEQERMANDPYNDPTKAGYVDTGSVPWGREEIEEMRRYAEEAARDDTK